MGGKVISIIRQSGCLGKSVCMNSLIISLLYKSNPEDVKLIMIDPKMVELGVYNGIPHLYIPVVTDPKKAAGALQWAVTEMLKRYRLFSELGVRSLSAYNDHLVENGQPKMPNVVVVIDELADLMLVASKEVEESICRVAQMGRAAGMHLVIATQRPSADVITGLMKANIPSRIAFAVSSALESRIILDNNGAEKLIGMGDMLYAPLGCGKPLRVQGAFVSDEERDAIVSFIKEQSTANYSEDIIAQIEKAVEDNIFLPLVLADKTYDEMHSRIVPIAKELGIAELLKKYPYEISGGQKQRAAVARALITNPRLILADEPTGALDSKATDELLRMFGEINRSGQTILMVTHSVKAASHASRVLFIKDGEVFHQIYRGESSDEQLYQKISDTLTMLATGGEQA